MGVWSVVLYLLNTLIVPFRDERAKFEIERVSAEEAKKIIQMHNSQFVSAIGHSASANALSLLLGVAVPVNRTEVFFNVGDEAIAMALKKRLAEGQVLRTVQELEAVGFDLYYIKRIQ
ncbi:hypothetical protein [Acidianus two-tailed phage variant 1]|uniref:DUF1874 domain-containing protein n=1 Tax=Acidianus two-tailed phage variant 1 TaxID=1898550 RepID=A0A1C9EG74_ATV|nr:hypothetical protein [Acidianus two-tailed phage variant 1]